MSSAAKAEQVVVLMDAAVETLAGLGDHAADMSTEAQVEALRQVLDGIARGVRHLAETVSETS